MQKAQISGNLGRDPETRYTAKGTHFMTFSVAVSNWLPASGDDEAHEETEWWNVTLWSPSDYLTNNLSSGTRVYVDGDFRRREYKRKDGTHGQSMDIYRANTVEIMRKPRSQDDSDAEVETRRKDEPVTASANSSPKRSTQKKTEEPPDLEDLPFNLPRHIQEPWLYWKCP